MNHHEPESRSGNTRRALALLHACAIVAVAGGAQAKATFLYNGAVSFPHRDRPSGPR